MRMTIRGETVAMLVAAVIARAASGGLAGWVFVAGERGR